MKHWIRWLPIVAILLSFRSASAEEVKVQYRLVGLFQPDRVDDLRRQAGSLLIDEKDGRPELKLTEVNYDTAVVTFTYDANSKHFKNQKPEQVLERINGLLSNVSKGSFRVFSLSKLKPDQLKEVHIVVEGLDCKGCAYSAYRSIATIEGVERAVVSFKEGKVTARIDSATTNREALVAALKKAEVDVIDAEISAEKPKSKK